MSEALKRLEGDVVTAMKAGDKNRVGILRMFVNKAKMAAKNDGNREPTDGDVLTAGLKTVKEANETRDIYITKGIDTSVQDEEISIVSEYLPQQMTEAQLRELLNKMSVNAPEGKSARGYYMKALNGSHKGHFDNRLAQQIIGEMVA